MLKFVSMLKSNY